MLNKRIEKELNKQLNAEFYSAYLYLSMAAFLASINLQGFSHWLKTQFEEEQSHALKFYEYILERGGRVNLERVNEPVRKMGNYC
jgi:ferritin